MFYFSSIFRMNILKWQRNGAMIIYKHETKWIKILKCRVLDLEMNFKYLSSVNMTKICWSSYEKLCYIIQRNLVWGLKYLPC